MSPPLPPDTGQAAAAHGPAPDCGVEKVAETLALSRLRADEDE